MLITLPTRPGSIVEGSQQRRQGRVWISETDRPLDRVLVIGSGPEGEWPLVTSGSELRRALETQLTALTGRPCAVQLICSPGMVLRRARAELASTDVGTDFDAVLLEVGAEDVRSLTPPDEWEIHLSGLLGRLVEAMPSAEVVVMAAQQAQPRWAGEAAGWRASHLHALRLNAVSRAVCAGYDNVAFALREASAPPRASEIDVLL